DLVIRVAQAESHAKLAKDAKVRSLREELNRIATRLSPIGLSAKVSENRKRLALLDHRNVAAGGELTRSRELELETTMAKLDALSPLSVLTRGYSLTQKASGEIVRDVHQTEVGARLNIRLSRGKLEVEVNEVTSDEGKFEELF